MNTYNSEDSDLPGHPPQSNQSSMSTHKNRETLDRGMKDQDDQGDGINQ